MRTVFEGELPTTPVEVVTLEARTATLFGSDVFLGVEEFHLPLAAMIETADGAELTPVDGHEQMVAVLHRPEVYPAESARPPGQSSGGRVMYREPPAEPAAHAGR